MLLKIFFIVFGINVLPAFGPPTWMILTYFQMEYDLNIFMLALVGTSAATIGRLTLSKLSSVLVRKRLMTERARANIDHIRTRLLEHKRLSVGLFLFYSFSPLPSNQLFLAYGLTDLPLGYIAGPFFMGRFFSYLFWVSTVSIATLKATASEYARGTFIGTYYVIVQILTLAVVYLFTKVDWLKLFKEKKLSLIK